MPAMPLAGPYLAAFELLQADFRRLGEYVELNDANLSTFSHRLYELLVRTCTEFESLCKELFVYRECSKKPNEMTSSITKLWRDPGSSNPSPLASLDGCASRATSLRFTNGQLRNLRFHGTTHTTP